MYNFKDKIEDYTEREFIELLGEFTNPTGDNAQLKGEELDKYWDKSRRTSYQNYTTSVDERILSTILQRREMMNLKTS